MTTSMLSNNMLLPAVMQVTGNVYETLNFSRVREQCYWTAAKLKGKANCPQYVSSHATAQGYN